MKISTNEVKHVANLARLNLDEQELETITTQLDTILSYVAKLDELDTDGVPTTTHAAKITNAFRDDVVIESLSQEDALINSPQQNDNFFVVPRVIK